MKTLNPVGEGTGGGGGHCIIKINDVAPSPPLLLPNDTNRQEVQLQHSVEVVFLCV